MVNKFIIDRDDSDEGSEDDFYDDVDPFDFGAALFDTFNVISMPGNVIRNNWFTGANNIFSLNGDEPNRNQFVSEISHSTGRTFEQLTNFRDINADISGIEHTTSVDHDDDYEPVRDGLGGGTIWHYTVEFGNSLPQQRSNDDNHGNCSHNGVHGMNSLIHNHMCSLSTNVHDAMHNSNDDHNDQFPHHQHYFHCCNSCNVGEMNEEAMGETVVAYDAKGTNENDGSGVSNNIPQEEIPSHSSENGGQMGTYPILSYLLHTACGCCCLPHVRGLLHNNLTNDIECCMHQNNVKNEEELPDCELNSRSVKSAEIQENGTGLQENEIREDVSSSKYSPEKEDDDAMTIRTAADSVRLTSARSGDDMFDKSEDLTDVCQRFIDEIGIHNKTDPPTSPSSQGKTSESN
ncbi:hypothetical protein GJ496_004246 [Pomphorhynchus laevis]|nr:hypothetical protein GJ496_004246 [Pomphorhynchus laevis]